MKSILKSCTPLSATHAAELGLINERAAANRLGVSVKILTGWRELGRGPMAYQINEHEFMYSDADIRTFESICLDSFHDLHGNDRPKQVDWTLQSEARAEKPRISTERLSFKAWLQQQA